MKTKNRSLNRFRRWHRWPGVVLGLFFIVWALSGIVMNHRELLAPVDMRRSWMAEEYQYRNWNNAAAKGSLHLGGDSILIYGNAGIWLTLDDYHSFSDYNAGFPKGIDHRKVTSLLQTPSGNLYAGTLFGLYFRDAEGRWRKINLPVDNERITDLDYVIDRVTIVTRSVVLFANDNPNQFRPQIKQLPAPVGYDNKVGLFKTLWVIHSGEIYGMAGKAIVDLVGLIVVLLTVTGMIHWIAPKILRRKKRLNKDPLPIARIKRKTVKWHKQAGIAVVVILIINTATGMFLRPPLLIGIANVKVGKIRFSTLDAPNPWHDKLRALIWDDQANIFIVGTNEGLYVANADLSRPLRYAPAQPPVSVMGINVFEKTAPGTYLVGSFNGLFHWMPGQKMCLNAITGKEEMATSSPGRPLSDHMISGLIRTNSGNPFFLDYNYGATPLYTDTRLPDMPERVIQASPMSLWNFALEVHTARFFKFIFGSFYILFIPIFGLGALVLLITGLVVWIKLFIRKRKGRQHCENNQTSDTSKNKMSHRNVDQKIHANNTLL